jgi:16S rRNA (uracil1498-N3)-methyltransferase
MQSFSLTLSSMFYFFSNNIENGQAYLNASDSKHCIQVLRMKAGDELNLLDGKGNVHCGVISDANKNSCAVQIQKTEFKDQLKGYKLSIAIAPTKNISRYEWFLEKACEIGVDTIYPITCKHSERKTIREDRLEKKLISAMKQSGNVYLPQLSSLCTFEDFLALTAESRSSRYIACMVEHNQYLGDLYDKDQDAMVLIGPEGGFTDDEIEKAKSYGFKTISLGKTRLRTETAGIFVCSAIKIINQ